MSNLPSLRTAVKWGAMALTLCAGLGSAAFEAGKAAFKFAHGEAADQAEPSLDKIEAKVLRQKEGAYTNVPSLKQFNRIESNNHGGPEIITIETGDFVAEPPLYGMRATGVFTTIGENGAITYEPVHAFMPDPVEFKDLAMTDHIVAERVFAQGKVLYPPELGMIDPNSIHLDGYTAADYTVTAGEQGRLLVTLNKPPVEPFKILYIARELDGYTVPFMDAQPAIPGIGNPELVEHIRSHDLKPYPTEDEYTFALRARSTIQREYHYPRGHAEESLSFNQAVAQHIGDCDVSNQELLAILQSNHVEAELVADFAPVPGREKHGQVRAIVYSQELDQTVIVSLDATPGTYTEASRSAQSAQAKKTEVRPVKPVLSVNEDAIEIESSQVETDQAELAALIDRYQAEHIGVSQLEDTAIDTGQTMLDEQQSAEERDTGTSENTGESAVVSTVTTQPETLNSLQEKTPATANPDVTSALEPVSEKEQKALAGGLYGYSHYLLRHSLSLPENKAAQVRLTTEFMLDVMQELKYKGVIPADQDPYEWSKHITPTRARQVVDALNHSDYIRFRLSLLSGMEYDRKAR